ncbi:hypothetical protein B0H10DRAFT_2019933 [Mycena sp. CBHHK59/15]|nr:hypothetical protein B0H10DRAFT_2019933 [Mycena sp. CBHHK59/15]
MARSTRRGTAFSPYELDALSPPFDAVRRHQIYQTNINAAPFFRAALVASDIRASAVEDEAADDDPDWEDVGVVLISGPPSPLSSCPSSPAATTSDLPHGPSWSSPPRPLSPLPDEPLTRSSTPGGHDSDGSHTDASDPGIPSLATPLQNLARRRQNDAAASRRKRKRTAAALSRSFGPPPQPKHAQDHRELPPLETTFRAEDLPSSRGDWGGPRPRKRVRRVRQTMWTKEQLIKQGCELVLWNGRDPMLVVDAEGRIVAVLLGTPEDPDWPSVIAEASRCMAKAREHGIRSGTFKAKDRRHRRGKFYTLAAGYSLGGGQQRPGNLVNCRGRRCLLRYFMRRKCFRRIAGFQSSGLANYAPRLYSYYCETMNDLREHHPGLVQNFTNSVFPAITFNIGPSAVSFEHCDGGNLPHGWCGLTSSGEFDHQKGGHLYLKQLKLLTEFPSGSTILAPSGSGETRESIAQYAAGGLFRWVAYGDQSAKSLLLTPNGAELKRKFDGEPGARTEWALGLFSKVDELAADRRAVFGNN